MNFGLLVLLFVFVFLADRFLPSYDVKAKVLQKGAVFALIAVSMNLLNGFTGLFSLGQAGFMLLGAYTYAIFTIPTDGDRADGLSVLMPPRRRIGNGSRRSRSVMRCRSRSRLFWRDVIAALFAFLIGLPVLRLKSDYLAIATLGFAEIHPRTHASGRDSASVTNGSNQLQTCTPPVRAFCRISSFRASASQSSRCSIRSTYGRAFKAIRDDEVAAEAMGVNLHNATSMIAFVISSFFAGVGGALLCDVSEHHAGQSRSPSSHDL